MKSVPKLWFIVSQNCEINIFLQSSTLLCISAQLYLTFWSHSRVTIIHNNTHKKQYILNCYVLLTYNNFLASLTFCHCNILVKLSLTNATECIDKNGFIAFLNQTLHIYLFCDGIIENSHIYTRHLKDNADQIFLCLILY